MFKRLKNWIFNKPAEDHAVASFAWFGLSYLALGTTAAFPALAPIAYGTAALASKIGLAEGIITGAHVIKNVLSWGFKKLFGAKKQATPVKTQPVQSNTKPEKSNEAEHQPQKSQEKPKTQEAPQPQKTPEIENPKPVQTPVTPKPEAPSQAQGTNKPQVVQVPAEQLMILMKQMQTLSAQIKQMQREILALRLENKTLKMQNELIKRRIASRRPKVGQLRTHRHYIKNGRMMHE